MEGAGDRDSKYEKEVIIKPKKKINTNINKLSNTHD